MRMPKSSVSCEMQRKLSRHADLGEGPSADEHALPGCISGKCHPAASGAVLYEQALLSRPAACVSVLMRRCLLLIGDEARLLPPTMLPKKRPSTSCTLIDTSCPGRGFTSAKATGTHTAFTAIGGFPMLCIQAGCMVADSICPPHRAARTATAMTAMTHAVAITALETGCRLQGCAHVVNQNADRSECRALDLRYHLQAFPGMHTRLSGLMHESTADCPSQHLQAQPTHRQIQPCRLPWPEVS